MSDNVNVAAAIYEFGREVTKGDQVSISSTFYEHTLGQYFGATNYKADM